MNTANVNMTEKLKLIAIKLTLYLHIMFTVVIITWWQTH